jgi:hypothetical protein
MTRCMKPSQTEALPPNTAIRASVGSWRQVTRKGRAGNSSRQDRLEAGRENGLLVQLTTASHEIASERAGLAHVGPLAAPSTRTTSAWRALRHDYVFHGLFRVKVGKALAEQNPSRPRPATDLR